jgi:HSP20 family protein
MVPQRRGPFSAFQEAFDNLFDRMFGQWAGPFGAEPGTMHFWDFDVEEADQEVIVRADMPGFETDDIDIRMDQNGLTIQAEQKQRGDEARRYRTYFRTVTLPTGVDADKVNATYHNGVLEVHVPRTEEAKPRRIQVQGERTSPALPGQAAAGRSTTQPMTGTATGAQSATPTGSQTERKPKP